MGCPLAAQRTDSASPGLVRAASRALPHPQAEPGLLPVATIITTVTGEPSLEFFLASFLLCQPKWVGRLSKAHGLDFGGRVAYAPKSTPAGLGAGGQLIGGLGAPCTISLQDEPPGCSSPAHPQEAPSASGRGKERSWDLTPRRRAGPSSPGPQYFRGSRRIGSNIRAVRGASEAPLPALQRWLTPSCRQA